MRLFVIGIVLVGTIFNIAMYFTNDVKHGITGCALWIAAVGIQTS